MSTSDFKRVQIASDDQENLFRTFSGNSKHPVKILLGIYKGNYGVLLKSFIYCLFQHSPVVALPIVTANIINIATYSEKYSLRDLIWNAVIMAILIVQNVISTYLCTTNRSIANRRVELGLRSSMARKLQQLSISFHKEMKSGKIQSKVMRDVESIEGLTSTIFLSGTSILLSLISAICITLSKSLIVFCFFLVSVPMAILLTRAFQGKLRRSNQEYRHEVENASSQVLEMVEMIPITKAHALENTALNRINYSLTRMAGSALHLDRVTAWFGSISWVVFQLFQLLALAFTGFLAYQKKIPIGDIALYQSYFSSIIASVSAIINLMPTITRGFESVRSVGEIMWAMDVEEEEKKTSLDTLEGTYEFKDVHFHYPDDPRGILNGLNLTVNKGETIALVGESGAGKSTVLNMIIGFYRPTSGTLLVDGKDITDISLHSYRSHIATVPQTSVLFSGSIRDNITFGLEHCSEERLQEAIRVANLQEMINGLPNGLDTMVGEHGDKLSGGQRQRIAIARAVVRNASVIIFDEATSALDTVSEKLIQDSLDKLSKNRTTFIVAHRLSTIRNADKIAVIKDGVCTEFGTWEELMELKGEFYTFRSLQT